MMIWITFRKHAKRDRITIQILLRVILLSYNYVGWCRLWYAPVYNFMALQWRHIVTLNRLFKILFKLTGKKTSKIPGVCEGNPPVAGEFPTQSASSAESVFRVWRRHGIQRIESQLDGPQHIPSMKSCCYYTLAAVCQWNETATITILGAEQNGCNLHTISNAYFTMKICEFRIKYHWNTFLVVRLTVN